MSFDNCRLCLVVASGSAACIADHTASAAASAPRAAAVFIFAAMAAPQNSGHNIEHDHVQELREPKCKGGGFEYALFFVFDANVRWVLNVRVANRFFQQIKVSGAKVEVEADGARLLLFGC